MGRARVWLVRAAIIGSGLGMAACDAASKVESPLASGAARKSTTAVTTTTTSTTLQDPTCRSGYQVAYRSDGTWYCEPVSGQ